MCCGTHFFIWENRFSLFLTYLNKSSLLSPLSCSSFWWVFRREVSGVPTVVGRPVRRHHRAGTLNYYFLIFFCLISSTPSSCSISTIKNFKIWINSPKSIFYIQEEKNETTFWWDRLFDSDRVTVSVSCVSVLVWIREAFGCCGLVCLCSPCRFRLCVDLDRGVCDCDCWVMVLDLIRKRWLVCACDVAVFLCNFLVPFASVCCRYL